MSARPFTFYPSLSADPSTWPWRNRVAIDGALISLDVLEKVPARLQSAGEDVKAVLGFRGFVILDNGAFGNQVVTDPLAVDRAQEALKPDVRIVLDVPTSRALLSLTQQTAVQSTIRYARRVVKVHGSTSGLLAVVQGNTQEQIASCAGSLSRMGFTHLGIPLSNLSKRRAYADAVTKVQTVREGLKGPVQLHALGVGSRTMMALMASLGVASCDSSSYYMIASRGDLYEPESMCSIGEPHSRPECASCLRRQRPPTTFRGRCSYNLRELLKEVQRSRCASEKGLVHDYLETVRLPRTAVPKVLPLLSPGGL